MKEVFSFQEKEIYFNHSFQDLQESGDYPVHAHETAELFYLISGTGRFLVEGTEYSLGSGDLILFRPAEMHRLYIDPNGPYERIIVHFPVVLFDDIDKNHLLMRPFYDRPLGSRNLYTSEEYPVLSGILKEMKELRPVRSLEHFQILSLLLHMLTQLGVIWQTLDGPADRSSESSIRLVVYVNAHLYEDISLESVSREFGISIPQTCRIFRKETGSSFWKYVSLKRLLAAHSRIIRGDKATEVAYACGFNEYSTFYRMYKNYFGCAPSAHKNREG